ncbi:hypothetical protein DNTS_022654 [Danionella cerebrum]|uniref:Centrosomal protein POC5 n=1 Tax=Danionella cerebrum TaxID=2873325 RepID=A0A553NGG3_9TELE|nr:hypothetical protein DNTS_022654 [Danionella translucida]
MSSEEEEHSSPDLPRDSDRGSSVSSALQEEYEELLRYAVVTPKFDQQLPSHQSNTAQMSKNNSNYISKRETPRQLPADDAEELSNRSTPNPPFEESRPLSHTSLADASMAARSQVSENRSARSQTISDRSKQSSPDSLITNTTEIFISEDNLNRMENILDTWSTNLKSNVMMELRKWKLVFMEQHRIELKKEKEKHAEEVGAMNTEIDSLKQLLNTYQISNQRKDEVIGNLSRTVDKQKEKLELMRSFTQWRLRQCAVRDEVQGCRLAEQHYCLQLKKKVWAGWYSLIQTRWRDRVERACCARAEDVCMQLSTDYEAKMAQHMEELQKAQAEIHKLHMERERYEDSMKKAFMRGVCALNIEALSMFNTGETARLERDAPPQGEEQSSSSTANHYAARNISPAHQSPVVMGTPNLGASHSNREDVDEEHVFSQASSSTGPRTDMVLSTTVVNSSGPLGSSTSTFKQANTRIVTAGKQKACKTISARLTARPAVRPPAALHVMGVSPPMSSVVVERHHPVTQLTIGQATAAKFPRSALLSQALSGNKSSSSQPRVSSCSGHIHSIKVVD